MRKAPRGGLSGRYAARSSLAATAGGDTQAGETSADKGEGGRFGYCRHRTYQVNALIGKIAAVVATSEISVIAEYIIVSAADVY